MEEFNRYRDRLSVSLATKARRGGKKKNEKKRSENNIE